MRSVQAVVTEAEQENRGAPPCPPKAAACAAAWLEQGSRVGRELSESFA